MNIRSFVTALFFIVPLMMQNVPAAAATFVGVRNVGSYSVDINIETDGTLGTLVQSNILDWNVIIKGPSGVSPLYGAKSPNRNSNLSLSGPLVAYSDRLEYLDNSIGQLFINYITRFPGEYLYYYCIQFNGCFDYGGPGEAVEVAGVRNVVRRTGVITFAAVRESAVPEPVSWAMMFVGFGLAGASLRSSRRRAWIASPSSV